MDDSPFVRLRRIALAASWWFAVRFGLFVAGILIAHQLPGWAKGPAWVGAFALGIWAYVALVRESRQAVDFLLPRLASLRRRLGRWMARHAFLWKVLAVAGGLLLAGIAFSRAWPAWHFLATSSLREDEILNIDRYTSQGFAPAVGTYNLARNHIFFNVVNSLIPGADSMSPLRGRFLSITAVLASLVLLVVYAARRGWLLAGVACAGFVAVDLYALKVLLEGRGYGLIGFFGTLGCIALAEWLRTRRPVWLTVLAVTCVLGAYTLPYYVVFGGSLLLVAFFHRPSRETLLAGFLSLAAVGMLYLPILNKVLAVASGYDDEYGDTVTYNFGSMDAVFRTMQYFFSYDVVRIGPLFFLLTLLLALLFMMFGRFAKLSDRHAAAGVALGVLAMLAFLFFLRSVPIRVSAFLAGPLAFLALVMAGSVLAAKSLAPIRPILLAAFVAGVGFVLWNAKITEPLLPRQNWSGFAQLVERAFPADVRVWVGGKYGKLMRGYLPPKRLEEGPIDQPALTAGELVAFDAFFKGGRERAKITWESLPDGVRYVTAPLLVNYQRLFFVPPAERGVARVEVEGKPAALIAGRQPRDPVTLSDSAGDGDALYKEDGPGEFSVPHPIPLPGTVHIELSAPAPRGVLNALFSQTLADKIVSAEVQDAGGTWRKKPPFVFGEMASVPLDAEGARAVRIHLGADAEFRPGPRLQGERPALGLMDAWVSGR
jgi:hypothetical protein